MSTFAHNMLSTIGQLLGDAEAKIYKVLSKLSHGRPVSTSHGIISIRTNENGFRQVYVEDTPLTRCGIERAVDILEELENMSNI